MKRIALFALLLLASCGHEHDLNFPPPLTFNFAALGTIKMDAARVTFVNLAGKAEEAYDVGNLYRPSIAETVKQWANQRLETQGGSGLITVTLHKASATTRGLMGALNSVFARSQTAAFDSAVDVTIEIQKSDGSIATARAQAEYHVTLPEDPSVAEKSKAYQQMLTGLMGILNKNLEISIRQNMAGFMPPSTPGNR